MAESGDSLQDRGLSPARRLESSAVSISFWLGGIALVCLKGLAYYLAGSSLIRASMFESLGDVVSSAIMQVTQWRVADNTDSHLYPVGKQRLAPLGILFFCAFLTSAMVSMALEAVSALTHSEEAVEGAGELLRRVFDEQPAVREEMSATQIDGIISACGDMPAGDDHQHLIVMLMALCVAVKGVCYVWCSYVFRATNSEIAKVLGADHRNDTMVTIVIIVVMGIMTLFKARGCSSLWMSKIDPAATLMMSLWITWCWVDTALEQVKLLSDRRVEDEEDIKKITDAVVQRMDGTFMRLHRIDIYHSGESFEARLEVFPESSTSAKLSVEQIASSLHELEAAVCNADVGVHQAHAKLKCLAHEKDADASWVAGYSTP